MTTAYRRDASFWANSKPGGTMPKYHAESLGGWAPCNRRIFLDPDSATDLSEVPADLRCARCFSVHWVGDAPTSLHGDGGASFELTTREPTEVTCTLCRTLLARPEPDDIEEP